MIVQAILSDITTAIFVYGKLGLGAAGIVAVLILLFRYISDPISFKQLLRRDGKHILIRALSVFYGVMVIAITILSREPGSRVRVDLILFSTISDTVAGQIYPIENILLFLPLGFFLQVLSHKLRKSYYLVTGIGFLLSVLIESIQYLTGRGYLQTDDVLLNTLGCVLGYAMINIVIYAKYNYVNR